MPIYEYACEKCGRHHEIVRKVSDRPLTRCPSCKGKLTRLLSPSAFQFKGTGWYVTDYAKKGSGPEKKDSGPEKKESGPEKKDGEKSTGKKEDGPKAAATGADD